MRLYELRIVYYFSIALGNKKLVIDVCMLTFNVLFHSHGFTVCLQFIEQLLINIAVNGPRIQLILPYFNRRCFIFIKKTSQKQKTVNLQKKSGVDAEFTS